MKLTKDERDTLIRALGFFECWSLQEDDDGISNSAFTYLELISQMIDRAGEDEDND